MSKQLKLNECKRVVNVDKFSEYAARLKEKRIGEEEIDRILDELGKKTPSRDVLLKTRLGFILKAVAENERLPKPVRDKARQLRTKWKDFHKRLFLAPKLDVKCDKPTTEGRERAKKSLETVLFNSNNHVRFDLSNESHGSILNSLEFEIFERSDKLVNARYFARVRVCVRAIENDPNWCGRLLRREVSCDKFVEIQSAGLDFFKNLRSSASQENVITQIIDNDDDENNDNFPSN